jgi:DNA polymerase-3 subunit epsilon
MAHQAPAHAHIQSVLHGGISAESGEVSIRGTRYVVFDTETTGLSPRKGDEIVQFAALRIVEGKVEEAQSFETLVDPGIAIPARATRIHGITGPMVRGKPGIAEVLRNFHAFAGSDILVAFNAAFDMAFLRQKEREAGIAFANPVLDPMLLAQHLDPCAKSHSLSALVHHYGIASTGRHSALGDAIMTAHLLVAMFAKLEAKGIGRIGKALALSNRLMRRRELEHRF